MKRAVLTRFEESDQGTFGHIEFGDEVRFTGELPNNDNTPNYSCIPAGKYAVAWTYSPAFKRMMYLVTKVKGRSGIRIHSANLMGDKRKTHIVNGHTVNYKQQLYGCIALGERLGHIKGQRALLISRPAISALERWADGDTFELEIIDNVG